MKPTREVINLISALLEMAADKFSTHGCNDFDLTEYLPDVSDRRQLMRGFHEWNGDPEEFDPDKSYENVGDDLLMSYFSEAIKDFVETEPELSFPIRTENFPQVGSKWFNNRRQKVYTIAGIVAHCESEDDEWEVLYRSDDMPEGQYRRRSLESWYGTNRDGQPRFVQIDGQ